MGTLLGWPGVFRFHGPVTMPPKEFPTTTWGKAIERYGLPTVALIVLVYCGREAAHWAATEVAAPIVATHVETIRNLQETQREIVKTQQQIASSVQRCCDEARDHPPKTAVIDSHADTGSGS